MSIYTSFKGRKEEKKKCKQNGRWTASLRGDPFSIAVVITVRACCVQFYDEKKKKPFAVSRKWLPTFYACGAFRWKAQQQKKEEKEEKSFVVVDKATESR